MRFFPPLAFVIVAGCLGSREATIDRPPPSREIRAMADQAVTMVRLSSDLACGTRTRRDGVTIVVATAEVCLSCRNIGYLIRRLVSDPRRETVVLVPAHQDSVVCAYLAVERVGAAVLRTDVSLFESFRFLTSRFAVIRTDSSWSVLSAVAERDPVDYLRAAVE